MLISFRDFSPQIQRKRLLGSLTDYENMQEVVTRVNRWIEQEGVRVLNVETVLTPKLPEQEEDSLPSRLALPSSLSSLHQVVRVWYVQEQEGTAPQTGATTRLRENALEEGQKASTGNDPGALGS
jgi:hypothetical protein